MKTIFKIKIAVDAAMSVSMLFLMDYLSVMVLFVLLGYVISMLMKRRNSSLTRKKLIFKETK